MKYHDIIIFPRREYKKLQLFIFSRFSSQRERVHPRWLQCLLQNLLFYYESDNCSRPSGVVLLEGCYCDRLITAKGKEPDKQVCVLVCAHVSSLGSHTPPLFAAIKFNARSVLILNPYT